MKLWSKAFADNAPIPGEFAFCVPDAANHVTLSSNRNPDLHWDDFPPATRSFVLICHDRDVPSKGDDVNQEGREVPASLPRVDFFHWVLIDIPPGLNSISAASHSDGVIARGKPGPEALVGTATAGGLRHGLNDYTGWFAGDADMKGDYFGYDGPCPPWNDSIVHHYVFTVYALDIERVPVEGKFTGAEVRAAIQGHVLAEASITGTYTLNPRLVK
ncbi:MAG: YbhB/YbcL family Raf kinase inhibitor-like protein [Cupriavidus sp.]|uniref:YbhB/YbcL family Raf kinase inhibitor-like protein n=1 Tax=Cupriavidus pauculus TaxID=82633 RepID=UPI000782F1A4|nr:YbhB/YbcL family Raf kinase inhibitor-like protein [Cupriavidus pauculus]MBU64184.1 YbhB/YbcL family Raf kinase inhibitor-like protein [Cupriavidus sp.]KAB0603199.1 YbhB/YbcL family Raf kinase inhibitor-like protein [Cupriavidus pauculus]MBY4732475.1 YbhB/YbcL family Raf kinase inhibitor-like protein [Cupriavidus pauculus]MCM3604554.1 YbhB/YbcL family Raf kinase inhibitor-like protein [Cupriavidus pauculus]UAK98600.1 YbhB/YbcL family Raf kinase inhibitor-like protein [Cupriavidus pauculus]